MFISLRDIWNFFLASSIFLVLQTDNLLLSLIVSYIKDVIIIVSEERHA